ncbi:MAG: transcriptional repressor [Verrucomicrobia bacterium]|nr:transcriptional repressor [Verrucomicrobiota bacterium]
MPPSPSRTPAKPTGLDCRLAVLGSDVRLTPHRREVFEVLASSTDHPTAYDILDRVKSRSPGMSLAGSPATVRICTSTSISTARPAAR